MRKSFLSAEAWPARGLGLFVALTLAACAALPGGTASKTAPKTKVASKASTAPKTPSPTPSLGLLLSGKVTVDPSSMLANKIATATSDGVKLISDNGLGLISDNGLGLISDNGLGLISDNGLGLISDNGLGLISDNGLGYRIRAVDDTPATGGALKPVEGMVVTAVNLYTGKVIAGPVATKADGSYQLGFYKTPDKNIGIVASVNVKTPVAKYTYATLIAPEAKPVITTDTTRALTRYLLGVLPGRIQPWVNKVKEGNPPQVDSSDSIYEVQLKQLISKIAPERAREADKMPDGREGAIALNVSQRLLAFVDLTTPAFQDFYLATEQARAWGETVQPQPETPLVDQVMKLAQDRITARQLPDFFKRYGMPADQADKLAEDLSTKGSTVGEQIILTLIAHQKDILAPIQDLADGK